VVRSLLLLDGQAVAAPDPAAGQAKLLTGSGHYLEDRLILSCRKGGIVTVTGRHHDVSDFGWIVERGETQFVTYWWSLDWRFREEGGAVTIEGAFFPHKEKVPTPFKHIVLRCLSFLLGRRLIAILKRVLIFKRGGKAELTLTRTIRRAGDQVEIIDRIGGLTASDRLLRAPRASKRHVASADSFHAQDMRLAHHNALEEQRAQEGGTLVVTTRLKPL
jgi:hypothetical protein